MRAMVRNGARRATDGLRSALAWASAYGLSVLIAFAAIYLTRADERVAAIWPLNAILLVAMVAMSPKRRLALAAAGVLGHFSANLLNGDSLPAAFLMSGANAVELGLLMAAMRGLSRARLFRRSSIIRMAIMSAVACVVSTTVAAVGLQFSATGASVLQTVLWFCAHLLGLLLFFPIAWAAREATLRTRDVGEVGRAWPEVGLVLVVSILVFAQSTFPLLYLVPPAMILVAFRRSFAAAILGLAVMALVAFWFTLQGIGPIPEMTRGIQSQIVVLQIFVGANTFMTLLMAATIAQRRRTEVSLTTARERLIKRLAEEQQLLRQAELAEGMSGVGYWSADLSTREVFWSPQIYRIRGLAAGEYQPTMENALDAYVEGDRERISGEIASALEARRGWTFEATLLRTDGDFRRIRSVGDCSLDDEGRIARIFGVVQDVTEDHRQLEAIKEREQLYRLLADNASDLIARYTPDGTFTYLSPSMGRMLGYAPGELIGKRTYDLILAEDVDQLHATFARGLKSGSPFSVQYRARRKNGEVVVLEARPSPDRDEHGEIVGYFDVVRDVTDRENRERELAVARRQAEEAAQVKAAFLSNMSHEIRTPLNGVLGFAQLLRQTDLDEQQARFADRISGAGEALLSVVNDILDFSKLEAGKLQLLDEPFSLVGKLEEVADIIRAAYPAIGDKLTLGIAPGLPELSLGDPHRLSQILTNLMGNAAKFAEGGSVAVTTDLAGDTIEIRIRDDGPGIAADRLDAIFEAFSQADGSIARKFGGTGLGLPISRKLARLMDGDVRLESQLGLGATAVLTLPNRPTERRVVPREAAAVSNAVSGLRVMVVDDAEMNRELIEISLKRDGCEPSVFEDAAGALAALMIRPEDFDVVLMDVQMPDIDGLEATRRIRRMDGPAAELPIIALTANVLPQQVADCRRAGMDDHVGKPIDFVLLRSKLARVAHHRTAVLKTSAALTAVPDDAMNGLRRRYRDHMGIVAGELEALLDQPDAPAEIARLGHSLAGTAGSLGFAEVSRTAFETEAAAKACGDTTNARLRAVTGTLITALQAAADEMKTDAQ